MLKLEIVLDEEKIKKDDIYELSDIYEVIDKLFTDNGLPKMETDNSNSVFYRDNGRNTDLGTMFSCIFYLEEQEWFMPYVKKWIYYNSDMGKDENDFRTEDIIEAGKKWKQRRVSV
ncbi:MAG: hypothetical protein IJ583_01110 [Firmicutes bacterium]|nr:hypothetical protein [Bacillota bacterium]